MCACMKCTTIKSRVYSFFVFKLQFPSNQQTKPFLVHACRSFIIDRRSSIVGGWMFLLLLLLLCFSSNRTKNKNGLTVWPSVLSSVCVLYSESVCVCLSFPWTWPSKKPVIDDRLTDRHIKRQQDWQRFGDISKKKRREGKRGYVRLSFITTAKDQVQTNQASEDRTVTVRAAPSPTNKSTTAPVTSGRVSHDRSTTHSSFVFDFVCFLALFLSLSLSLSSSSPLHFFFFPTEQNSHSSWSDGWVFFSTTPTHTQHTQEHTHTHTTHNPNQ